MFTSLAAIAQRSAEDALALQYYQNGEFDKAALIFEKLYKRGNNVQQYYDQYLSSLIKLKRYADAEKVVKQMMKSFPDNFNYQIDYGRLLQEQGQQEKADALYSSAIKNLPANEFAIRDLSIAFYRANSYDLSVKVLVAGRRLLKNDRAFAFDLIALYRFQKNKTMLVQEYLDLLSEPAFELQVLNQAKNTFSDIFESGDDFNILKMALLRRLQKDPGNTAYTDLLAWQYLQQKEYSLALKQVIALDKRLKEEGDRVFELSMMFISDKAYNPAIEGLEYLLGKGNTNQYYIPAKIQILNTKSKLLTEGKYTAQQLMQLEKEYVSMLDEFGRNRNTIFATRQLANLQAYYLHKLDAATEVLEAALKTPNLPPSVIAQLKLELGDLYVLSGEVWEAALVYGQVEKASANEPSGQEAKFRGAKLSYYQGEFTWAKAQLDVLKSSTSNLIANDALNLSLLIQENTNTPADTNALKKYAYADMLIFKNKPDEALKVLDSIHRLFPGNSLEDDILMSKARIYLKTDQIQDAVRQLQSIVDNYGGDLWADDALFTLGDIYETKLKEPETAKAYFQKIITDMPGSLHVAEARKRFRTLRGDAVMIP